MGSGDSEPAMAAITSHDRAPASPFAPNRDRCVVVAVVIFVVLLLIL